MSAGPTTLVSPESFGFMSTQRAEAKKRANTKITFILSLAVYKVVTTVYQIVALMAFYILSGKTIKQAVLIGVDDERCAEEKTILK